jgi:Protein of unknown function (DUF3352)
VTTKVSKNCRRYNGCFVDSNREAHYDNDKIVLRERSLLVSENQPTVSENQPNVPEDQADQPKYQIIVIALICLAIVWAVLYFGGDYLRPRMVTKFYRYYPPQTIFYLEASPGEKLSLNLFKRIETLLASSGNNLNTQDVPLAEVFQKDFQPTFSYGIWAAKGTLGSHSVNQATPTLIAVSLKPEVTPKTLAADLKVPMDNFQVTSQGDAQILISKNPQYPLLAFHDHTLLIANSTNTLNQALNAFKTQNSLLNNALFKWNARLLPKERQGTLFSSLQMQFYPNEQTQNKTIRNILLLQRLMQKAAPVLVASIRFERDQIIHFESFTHMDLSQLPDDSFRKDFQRLFQKQESLNLAQVLPQDTVFYGSMVGLGGYYDLFNSHIADEDVKKTVSTLNNQLKIFGLDLRKNLISLVDGESAIDIVEHQNHPDLLIFLTQNPDNQKTMDQLGMVAAKMSRGAILEKNVDSTHSIKLVASPAFPLQIGYSNFQNDVLVLGSKAGLEGLYERQQKKQSSLKDSRLYQDLFPMMPSKVNSVFYVDVHQVMALLDQLVQHAPRGVDVSRTKRLKDLLNGVEGIGGVNTLENENMFKGYYTVKLSEK